MTSRSAPNPSQQGEGRECADTGAGHQYRFAQAGHRHCRCSSIGRRPGSTRTRGRRFCRRAARRGSRDEIARRWDGTPGWARQPGQQAYAPRVLTADEEQGVQVGASAQQAPVQAAPGWAVRAAGQERPDGLPGSDHLPEPDRGEHRLVGRPEPAGVQDHHHPSPGERSGESDRARPAGTDRSPGDRGEVHPTVALAPGLQRGRWVEAADDHEGAVQRPDPGRAGGPVRGGQEQGDGECEDEGHAASLRRRAGSAAGGSARCG